MPTISIHDLFDLADLERAHIRPIFKEGFVIGIDYGTTKCGIAICDIAHEIPTPYSMVETTDVINTINRLISEYNSCVIVVGYPFDYGTAFNSSHMQNKILKFTQHLKQDLLIILQDENNSSNEMFATYKSLGLKTGSKFKKSYDTDVACKLLEKFTQDIKTF